MNDPYVYKGTNVLINKLNIKDSKTLNKAETDFAILGITKLRKSKFEIASIFDGLTIHKILFSRLYEWAGEIRSIDIYKGEPILNNESIDYVFASYINKALIDLNKEFCEVIWSTLSNEEKILKITYFVSEFWHIHPFREGNTRTSAMLLYFLIRKANLHIDFDFLSKNSKYFRNALVLSCLYSHSKTEYLEGIIKDAVTLKNLNTGHYQTINGMDVEKYTYQNHTLEKIKTINKPKDWNK